jgi:predicted HTH transcriptional regulator
MPLSEFNDDLKQFIYLGQERVNVEFKANLTWGNGQTNNFIAKAMMAMSNSRDGGVIIIGVEDGTFNPVGLSQTEVNSYEYDTIGRYMNNHAQPSIDFTLEKGQVTEADGTEKLFVVIQVQEANALPIVCTKTVSINPAGGAHLGNLALREGAVYIRSKSPVESREISGHREWRDFVDLLLDRHQNQLVSKIPWKLLDAATQTVADADHFNQQLEDL